MENYPISHLAISLEKGALESARYFIDAGADLELVCFDKTPLMYAVKHGHLELVTYLIEKGARVDVISVEDKTALDYAIKYGHPEIEAYLRTVISKPNTN
ncbi:ankyrin repeat domain-containing protein [Winogradskyella aurantiaca]|uniref:ankyrin repeat domain-containing protein n=1 Tax=Winogradskyella aurantiaca TaxID=2219558 RepID=UPI000E1E1DE9|nr:ankyrin repeat domain-containing protein [Winogradskyella aurantiaca]